MGVCIVLYRLTVRCVKNQATRRANSGHVIATTFIKDILLLLLLFYLYNNKARACGVTIASRVHRRRARSSATGRLLPLGVYVRADRSDLDLGRLMPGLCALFARNSFADLFCRTWTVNYNPHTHTQTCDGYTIIIMEHSYLAYM